MSEQSTGLDDLIESLEGPSTVSGDKVETAEQPSGDVFEPEEEVNKPLNQHPRFQELIKQKNEFKAQISELQEKLTDMQKASNDNSELRAAFLEIYNEFEEPAEMLRRDAMLADAVTKLYEAEGDDDQGLIHQALQRVNEFIKSGVVTKMASKDKNQSRPSDADSRLQKLIANQWRSEIDGLLKTTAVRPELHSVIRDAVMQRVNVNEDPSRSTVIELARDYISGNGWSKEFLVGQPIAKKSEVPPTARSGGVGSVSIPSEGSEGPKTVKDLDSMNRQELESFLVNKARMLAKEQ